MRQVLEAAIAPALKELHSGHGVVRHPLLRLLEPQVAETSSDQLLGPAGGLFGSIWSRKSGVVPSKQALSSSRFIGDGAERHEIHEAVVVQELHSGNRVAHAACGHALDTFMAPVARPVIPMRPHVNSLYIACLIVNVEMPTSLSISARAYVVEGVRDAPALLQLLVPHPSVECHHALVVARQNVVQPVTSRPRRP